MSARSETCARKAGGVSERGRCSVSCRIELLITLHCLQEHLKESGSRKITDRYEAHEESKLITERKGSYCEQKVLAGEAERAINEGEQQNEAVESRRGFAVKIEEQSRLMMS